MKSIVFLLLFLMHLVAYADNNPKYEAGLLAYNSKNFSLAITYFSEAISIENTFKAYFYRGLTFNKLKQYQEALNDFKNALALDPYNSDAYYYAGFAAMQLKNYQEASNLLKGSLKLKPNQKNALNYLYFCLKELNDYESLIAFAQAALQGADEDIKAKYYLGYAMYMSGQYQAATSHLIAHHEFEPTHVNTLKMLGDAFLKLEIYDSAKIFFSKLNVLIPSDKEPLYNLLFLAQKTNDKAQINYYRNALIALGVNDKEVILAQGASNITTADINKALEQNENNDQLWIEKARIYFVNKQHSKALDILNKNIKHEFNDDYYDLKSQIHIENNAYDLALADLNKIKKTYNIKFYNAKKAFLLVKTNQIEAAEQLMSNANASTVEAHKFEYIKGLIALNKGNKNEAKHLFADVIGRDSLNTQAHLALANVYFDEENWNEASNAYLKALQPKHNECGLLNNLALSLSKANRINEAQSYFIQLIQQCKAGKYHLNYGIFLLKNNSLFEAENQLLAAESELIDNKAVYYNLGILYLKKQNYAFAKSYLSKAEGIDGVAFENYTYNLAVSLMHLSLYDEAVLKFNTILVKNSLNDTVWAAKGACLLNQKKYHEALICIQKAIEINKNDFQYFLNLGIVYNKLELYEKAREVLQKSLELNPNYKESLFALGYALYMMNNNGEACKALSVAKQSGHQEASKLSALICN